MPRKSDDFEFQIYVDPSCLSDPMDENVNTTSGPPPAEEATDTVDILVAADQPQDADEVHNNDAPPAGGDVADVLPESESSPLVDEQPGEIAVEKESTPVDEAITEEQPDAGASDQDGPEAVEVQDIPTAEDEPTEAQEPALEEAVEADAPAEVAESIEPAIEPVEEPVEELVEEPVEEPIEEPVQELEDNEVKEDAAAVDESLVDAEQETTQPEEISTEEISTEEQDEAAPEDPVEEEESFNGDDAETPKPTRSRNVSLDGDGNYGSPSRFSERKTSLRTEALIQAAARAVVAKLEMREDTRDSTSQIDEEEADTSLLSTGTQERYGQEDAHSSYDDHGDSRRQSVDSQLHHSIPSRSVSGDEGGDSSSHHEADDDVFSDRSARSSIGSFDGANDNAPKPASANDSYTLGQSYDSNGRSPRISGVSIISGFSQYEKDDFVPTSRETRIPFRTPSAVRAMQMTSPTPSVFNGASPRSGKRQTVHSASGGTRMSHLGSPTVSAQYSPKGRSTPTRFKSRKEAPLILLHVTLLPLRWIWGDVLNGLDLVNGKALDDSKPAYEASEQLKTLRDAWRELQDCVGDTVLERGVLLAHPQNDFEVLEERLLEALELPLRRRARILECGHYLGPANIMNDDDASDDGYASETGRVKDKKHWCNTCKGEISYEDLGPGKVFRVKVYASNGLMRAGAWEACWKDMERVDVDVEPIVEPVVQGELERLAALQNEFEEQRQQQEAEAEAQAQAEAEAEAEFEQEMEQERGREREREPEHNADKDSAREEEPAAESLPSASDSELPYVEAEARRQSPGMSSPPSAAMHASPPQPPSGPIMRVNSPTSMQVARSSRSVHSESMDISEDRRRRDEERFREIYGDMPTPQPFPESASSVHGEATSSRPRHPDSYIPPPTPRSPSEEIYERRKQRDTQRRSLENASFTDLLMEAFKVLLRDPKNVAIIVLCLFLACVMVRPAPQTPAFGHDQLSYRYDAKPEVAIHTPAAKVEPPVNRVPEILAPTTNVPETAVAMFATQLIANAPSVEPVFDAAMGTSAAVEAVNMFTSSLAPELPTSSPMPEMALPIPSDQTPDNDQQDNLTGAAVVLESILLREEPVDDPSAMEAAAAEEAEEVSETAQTPDVSAVAEEVDAAIDDELELTIIEPILEPLAVAVEADVSTPSASSDPTEPTQESGTSAESKILDSSAANDGVETLPSSLPETVDSAEEPAQEVEEEAEVVDASSRAEPVPLEAAPSDPELELVEPLEDPAPVLGQEKSDVVKACHHASSKELPDVDVPLPDADVPALQEEPAIVETELPNVAHPCDNYVQAPRITACAPFEPAVTAPASHAFPVLEKKTVRIYETITRTVKVRVSATETVFFIETAIPQTIEETVYETETIRITVSIPMDSELAAPTRVREL
ncbi:hypothetical protein B0H67DRAFT_649932 [Lasiosphaeris hirsuta]|uniref:Pathway-specific nitrogen regulator n=1 Tax=Lasiosphaeris hirsuta TaxID=260670 RepID=A0AA39ZY29_9PEZI|nr:hypothetical protein B0H67DRAFT_649932 [Lasiosphaeris hirsuta]